MRLRVDISCVDCGEKITVYMISGWDISTVRHSDCPQSDSGLGVGPFVPESDPITEPRGSFTVTYDPPRSTF